MVSILQALIWQMVVVAAIVLVCYLTMRKEV
jgi:hypothetical protein